MLIAGPNEGAAITESSAHCCLKALLHKPHASSTEEWESQRHTVAMQSGKEQWDTLSRSENDVFSIDKPFKRSHLSVLVTFQHYSLCQPPQKKDVLHNTSASNNNINLQMEKGQTGSSQPLHDSI